MAEQDNSMSLTELLEAHRRERERLVWEGTFREYFAKSRFRHGKPFRTFGMPWLTVFGRSFIKNDRHLRCVRHGRNIY